MFTSGQYTEMAKGLAEHVHGGRVAPDNYTKFWIEGDKKRPVTDVMFSTRFVRKADKRAFKFDTGYPYIDDGGPTHFGFRVELDKRPAEAVAELSHLLSRPDVSARILAVPGTELLAERYLDLPFWKCHMTGPVDQRRSEMAARSLDLIYAVLPALAPVTLDGEDFILR